MGEGNGTPLQYSCLENPMDGGAWKAAVYGVTEGRTRLSDFTITFPFHALEKEMATHSSVLAWRIPGMWEPGGLPSTGSHRVRHDWSDLAAVAAAAAAAAAASYCLGNEEKHLCCLSYEYLYGEWMVLGDPQTSSQIKRLVDSSIDTTDPTSILTPILKQNHWPLRRGDIRWATIWPQKGPC